MNTLFKTYLAKAIELHGLDFVLKTIDVASEEEIYKKCKEDYEEKKEVLAKIKADYIKAAEELKDVASKEKFLWDRNMHKGICLYANAVYHENLYSNKAVDFMWISNGYSAYMVDPDRLTPEERITKRIEKLNEMEEMFS